MSFPRNQWSFQTPVPCSWLNQGSTHGEEKNASCKPGTPPRSSVRRTPGPRHRWVPGDQNPVAQSWHSEAPAWSDQRPAAQASQAPAPAEDQLPIVHRRHHS